MSVERLAFSFDMGTFAVLKAMLESEGIPVLDLAQGGHVAIAGADQGFYVQILGEDRARAERVMRERGFERYLVTRDP
jgi:hypothetical protein